MTLHWAPDEKDASKTACNMVVGYVLAETGDEITLDARCLLVEHDVCLACCDAKHPDAAVGEEA